jgi:hypothetical protein
MAPGSGVGPTPSRTLVGLSLSEHRRRTVTNPSKRRLWSSAFILLCLCLTLPSLGHSQTAQEPPTRVSSSTEDEKPKTKRRARWKFKDEEKPVKVIVLAGSIGAKRREAYHNQLQGVCSATEFVNLSKVGHAVQGLIGIWQREVSENRRLARSRSPEEERWALFGGGLNNIGTRGHYSAAHYMLKLFSRMKRDGFRVIATSVSPWGDNEDDRWEGYSGLLVHRTSLALAGFLAGDLTPSDALGRYLRYRRKSLPGEQFEAAELPARSINLYTSSLRENGTRKNDFERGRKMLLRSRSWRKSTRKMTGAARAVRLQQDAEELAALPQWYLRPELQGFDPIHPNARGHRLMASVICPELPDSWRCDCNALMESD